MGMPVKPFPFQSILLLIFITLKLCGVIAWSWWWVMAPLWIPIALALLFGILWALANTHSPRF